MHIGTPSVRQSAGLLHRNPCSKSLLGAHLHVLLCLWHITGLAKNHLNQTKTNFGNTNW